MNNKTSINNGGVMSDYMTPLISFNTIFDLDYGLIQLIKESYFDQSVFQKDYFIRSSRINDILVDLYCREAKNPLYIMAKEEIDKDLLDQYYGEFLLKEQEAIHSHCITTSVLWMVKSFNESQVIKPYILCFNDIDVKYVKDEPFLKKIPIIMKDELISKIDLISSFYFKDVDEAETIQDKARSKNIYFASYGPNLSGNDLCNPDLINKLIKNNNQIGVFDYYDSNILGG